MLGLTDSIPLQLLLPVCLFVCWLCLIHEDNWVPRRWRFDERIRVMVFSFVNCLNNILYCFYDVRTNVLSVWQVLQRHDQSSYPYIEERRIYRKDGHIYSSLLTLFQTLPCVIRTVRIYQHYSMYLTFNWCYLNFAVNIQFSFFKIQHYVCLFLSLKFYYKDNKGVLLQN